jgi:hypothetical protein
MRRDDESRLICLEAEGFDIVKRAQQQRRIGLQLPSVVDFDDVVALIDECQRPDRRQAQAEKLLQNLLVVVPG